MFLVLGVSVNICTSPKSTSYSYCAAVVLPRSTGAETSILEGLEECAATVTSVYWFMIIQCLETAFLGISYYLWFLPQTATLTAKKLSRLLRESLVSVRFFPSFLLFPCPSLFIFLSESTAALNTCSSAVLLTLHPVRKPTVVLAGLTDEDLIWSILLLLLKPSHCCSSGRLVFTPQCHQLPFSWRL